MARFEVRAEPLKPECGDCAALTGNDPAFAGQMYCAEMGRDAMAREGVEGVGFLERFETYCSRTQKLRSLKDRIDDINDPEVLLTVSEWIDTNSLAIKPGPTYAHDVGLAAEAMAAYINSDDVEETVGARIKAAELELLRSRYTANRDTLPVAASMLDQAQDKLRQYHQDPIQSSLLHWSIRGMADVMMTEVHLRLAQHKIEPEEARYQALEVLTDVVMPFAEELTTGLKEARKNGQETGTLRGALGELAAYVMLFAQVIESDRLETDVPYFVSSIFDETSVPRIKTPHRMISCSADVGIGRGRITPEANADWQVKVHAEGKHPNPHYEQPINPLTMHGKDEEFNDCIEAVTAALVLGEDVQRAVADNVVARQILDQVPDYNDQQWAILPKF